MDVGTQRCVKIVVDIRGGIKNIARGTTDPEIDSMTWTKFGNNMAPLALEIAKV